MFIRPYFELDEVYAEVDLVDDEATWTAWDFGNEQPAFEVDGPDAEVCIDDGWDVYWNWKMKNWDIDDEFDMEYQWYMSIIGVMINEY